MSIIIIAPSVEVDKPPEGGMAAHFRPVAVDESTIRTKFAVAPTASRATVLSAVPTKRSPLALMVLVSIALDGRDEYERLAHAVEPSPILYLAVSVSRPSSP